MTGREGIFVFGASGHAKVILDIIEQQGVYEVAIVVDDDPAREGTALCGYPVAGGKGALLASGVKRGVIAIGSNKARAAVAQWLSAQGMDLVTVLHPSAQVARSAVVGRGTVVMPCACINPDSQVGRNVIINTNATVEHDCTIGDHVHIAPGATLCGTVTVGEGSFVCAGATVLPNVSIGSNVTIGAGSTVICDIADQVTVVGSPARVIKPGR